jgi:hypothetical protein
MSNKTHNGYTNNATWRVMVEILGDLTYTKPQTTDSLRATTDSLRAIVEWYVFGDDKDTTLKGDYARAFLRDVNYDELLKDINDEID